MKKTKNYAMPYPEQDDYFNVEDFQDMMVSVDDLMKKLSDSGGVHVDPCSRRSNY